MISSQRSGMSISGVSWVGHTHIRLADWGEWCINSLGESGYLTQVSEWTVDVALFSSDWWSNYCATSILNDIARHASGQSKKGYELNEAKKIVRYFQYDENPIKWLTLNMLLYLLCLGWMLTEWLAEGARRALYTHNQD